MQAHRITLWIIACLILTPSVAQAVSPPDLVEKGNRAYQAGNYDGALKAYDEAGVDAVKSPQIDFNRGAAYFKKGDLKKAKDAWEKAALNSKEIPLEARALFNIGDCEFFEAKRQKDSDPQKAIDACTRSIKYFQQALDLLKKPEGQAEASLKKDTSENIEIVRLVMKSILDDMKKQQEQAKKQQQAANNLKKSKGENSQGKQKQNGKNQTAEKKEAAGKKKAQASDQKNKENQQKQNTAIANSQDDAQSILNDEKANKKKRMPVSAGGYREVEKDW